tara:strand:+ start:735 stop:1406 length:672 start_codon:yes stop_codon:yes gene_type:complete
MNLSKETLEVLNNFASINPNILISPGQQLKTISEAKNILATAEIIEDFPLEFGIYDLNEFLNVLNIVDNPNLRFEKENVVIENDSSRVNYFYSSSEILTSPQKDITMPDPEFNINISEEQLNKIRKAAAVLGHNELAIVGDNGAIHIEVLDTNDATANKFTMVLETSNPCINSFRFIFNIPNLKLLPGDYFVSISSKCISNWVSSTYPINYFIALEKSSEFHV